MPYTQTFFYESKAGKRSALPGLLVVLESLGTLIQPAAACGLKDIGPSRRFRRRCVTWAAVSCGQEDCRSRQAGLHVGHTSRHYGTRETPLSSPPAGSKHRHDHLLRQLVLMGTQMSVELGFRFAVELACYPPVGFRAVEWTAALYYLFGNKSINSTSLICVTQTVSTKGFWAELAPIRFLASLKAKMCKGKRPGDA